MGVRTVVIEVQLFATLRDRRPGHDPKQPEPVELEDDATVEDLIATLDLTGTPLFVFVERRKVGQDRVLAEGERVGLFPPMVGG